MQITNVSLSSFMQQKVANIWSSEDHKIVKIVRVIFLGFLALFYVTKNSLNCRRINHQNEMRERSEFKQFDKSQESKRECDSPTFRSQERKGVDTSHLSLRPVASPSPLLPSLEGASVDFRDDDRQYQLQVKASIMSRVNLEYPTDNLASTYSYASVTPYLFVGGERCLHYLPGMSYLSKGDTLLHIITGDADLKDYYDPKPFEDNLEKPGSQAYFVYFPESAQGSEWDWNLIVNKLPHIYDRFTDARRSGRKTLIHCAAGANRSVTCVLYCLLRDTDCSLNECLEYIHKLRPAIRPKLPNLWALYQFRKKGILEPLRPTYLDDVRRDPEFIKSLDYINTNIRYRSRPYAWFLDTLQNERTTEIRIS